MKNSDNQIKEILSQKLAEHESFVRPELWNAIQSQLAIQSVNAGIASTVAKVGISKLWWAAAIAIATATIVAMTLQNADSNATTKGQKQEPVESKISVTSIAPSEAATALNQNKAEQMNDQMNEHSKTQHITPFNTTMPDDDFDIQEVLPTGHRTVSETITEIETMETEIADVSSKATSLIENKITEIVDDNNGAKFSVVTVSAKDLRYFFIPENDNANKYLWNFGDGTSSSEMSPSHTFDQAAEYNISLSVYDNNDLVKTQLFILQANRPIELNIPNIFTPNGDGKNDAFEIITTDQTATITKIIILNVEGKVFESDGNVMWDGNMQNGQLAPSGTYTFLVRASSAMQSTFEKAGVVTLLR